MSVAVTLFCDCPIAQGDFPGVLEGNRSVGITFESVQNGVLSRVPSLSVYEFRLFFSLYSQRKYTRWGGGEAQSGLQKQSSLLPESIECWQFTNSARCFQESRERARERLRQKE